MQAIESSSASGRIGLDGGSRPAIRPASLTNGHGQPVSLPWMALTPRQRAVWQILRRCYPICTTDLFATAACALGTSGVGDHDSLARKLEVLRLAGWAQRSDDGLWSPVVPKAQS